MSHGKDKGMRAYYRDRAPIYDRVYSYPERQSDLRYLEQYIPEQFTDRDVLEIAAGTGYWTQFIADQASSILATDVTEETLQHIEKYSESITTQVVDAYDLGQLPATYTGVFAGLWLSHVPKDKLSYFISEVHSKTTSGAVVMFIDNSAAQCERLPITRTDDLGNTYQSRELDDRRRYEVLKNFPTEPELLAATCSLGRNHKFIELDHYWLFQYTIM